MRGRFITFEGGEGAGKSTQARLLACALEARGLTVLLTREPGGTPGSEAIRTLLLDPAGEGWSARAEALLFAAARSDHVERVLRPALERGDWVICDRFVDSSCAYQGSEGELSAADITELHRIGSAGLLPDLTLLIHTPPAIAAARLAMRDNGVSDRIGAREGTFHEEVARRFDALARSEPQRIVRIAGGEPPGAVHETVLRAVEGLLARTAP